MKKILYLMVIAGLILVIIPYSLANVNAESNQLNINEHEDHEVSQKEVQNNINHGTSQELTEEQIVSVTQEFLNHLVQETDENYQVKNYQSLKEYKGSFSHMASEKVVNMFVDYLYEEEGQALYIIPTETPAWFVPSNDYEVNEQGDNTYQVTQTNDMDLYGKYTIIFDIKLNANGQPYIMNVQYQ